MNLPPIRWPCTDTFRGTRSGPSTEVGGEAVGYIDITKQLSNDLRRASEPCQTFFSSAARVGVRRLVAAGLPLIIGICSIVGTVGLLTLLTKSPPVSNYALNLTTILGLGLAID